MKDEFTNTPDVNEQIYKYGITSALPFGDRPDMQRTACKITMMAGECGFKWLGTPVIGYQTARVYESGYIQSYMDVFGHCPPGQYTSCR